MNLILHLQENIRQTNTHKKQEIIKKIKVKKKDYILQRYRDKREKNRKKKNVTITLKNVNHNVAILIVFPHFMCVYF